MVSTMGTDRMQASGSRHRTPDQILGPYFPTGQTPAPQADLTSVNGRDGLAQGEIIEVTGRILNLAGEPVPGVPQASEGREHVGVRGQRPHRGDGPPVENTRTLLHFIDATNDYESRRMRHWKYGCVPDGPTIAANWPASIY